MMTRPISVLRALAPALLLASCTHDYDEFSFVGPGTGGAAGAGGAAGMAQGGNAGANGGGSGVGGSGGSVANQPGQVTCATSNECEKSTSYCCASPTSSACVASAESCPAIRVECDGPEDCGGAQVCCAEFDAMRVECRHQNDCGLGQGRFVVCGDQPAACTGGTSCKPAPSLTAYNVCSSG